MSRHAGGDTADADFDGSPSPLRARTTASRSCAQALSRRERGQDRPEFTLAEVYGFEARLSAIYPGNNNVGPKIRQQLQMLRDMGWLAFNGRGTYRRTE